MTVYITKQQEQEIINSARKIAAELSTMSSEEVLQRLNKIDYQEMMNNSQNNIDQIVERLKEKLK